MGPCSRDPVTFVGSTRACPGRLLDVDVAGASQPEQYDAAKDGDEAKDLFTGGSILQREDTCVKY